MGLAVWKLEEPGEEERAGGGGEGRERGREGEGESEEESAIRTILNQSIVDFCWHC